MQSASRSIQALALAGSLSLSVLSVPSVAQNPSPTLIPFQAQLTNQNNVLYQTGTYTITFNLYDQAVGGASLWTERHLQVGVISGAVNLFLGSIQTLPAAEFTKTLYLGITIDADNNANTPDPEMIPRQMIIPAFHSKNAEKLAGHDWSAILVGASNDPSAAKIRGAAIEPEDITAVQIRNGEVKAEEIATGVVDNTHIADGSILPADLDGSVSQGLIPPGTILPYAGTTPPPGFFMCNGGLYSKTSYPALAAVLAQSLSSGAHAAFGGTSTHFRVPDLEGRFLRGTSNGTGRDPDATGRSASASGGNSQDKVGSLQDDQLKSHVHGGILRRAVDPGNGTTPRQLKATSTTYQQARQDATGNNESDNSDAFGGSETRPKNVNVNFIIKH